MKKLCYIVFALLAVCIAVSCSSNDDGEQQESLYDVSYSEIVYTIDSSRMFVEYAHPKDSCIFYYFGDYKEEIGPTKLALPSSKEVYYKNGKKQNKYLFTYTFSNSTAYIKYNNGNSETIKMKKNCKGTPHYDDKVYFNDKPFARVER